MTQVKPRKVRMDWNELHKIEAEWKSDGGPASKDIKRLMSHIRFIEHLLDAAGKEMAVLRDRVEIRDEMLEDSQAEIHKLLDNGQATSQVMS